MGCGASTPVKNRGNATPEQPQVPSWSNLWKLPEKMSTLWEVLVAFKEDNIVHNFRNMGKLGFPVAMVVRALLAFSLPTLHFFGEGCPLRLARLETPRPKHRLRIVSREEVSAQLLRQSPPDPLICTNQLWLRAPTQAIQLQH